ncbi:MAG: type II secretion system F family protein [Candidatus Paceibacterota bacterium]
MLCVQWEDPDFKQTIMEISEDVEGGSNLSEALSRYPETFSRFYIAMVKAGEASGNLSDSLNYLADYLERKNDLNSKIKGAALYPAFVVGVIIMILALMVFFVFPRLEQVLQEGTTELPLMTKLTLSSASFLRQWGWLLVLIIAFLFTITLRYFRKTDSGRKKWDQVSLQLPLIGPFLKKIYLSRFARNLSTLIQGGLPITQALEITGKVVGNSAYKKVILNTRNEVRRGEAINVVLSQHPELIPPLVTQMVSVGEKTGTLDSALMHIVDFYEKEVERFSENLLNLLEPILIIILGVVVGAIVLTVFMPLYQLRMGGI